MKKAGASGPTTERKIRPALTPEAREKQLVALAVDLVEKRLREGTASSQEVTQILNELAYLHLRLKNHLIVKTS